MPEFRVREAPTPRGVVVSDRAARILSATKRFELRCEYDNSDELTAAVDVNAALPAQLDDDGIVTIGTVVSTGMILVGKLSPSRAVRPGDEKAIDDALGISPMRDASLRCSPDVDGRVVDVRRFPARGKERAVIEISIDGDRPLAVGDVLELDGGTRDVVASIADLGDDDIAWPGAGGTRDVHRVDTAVDLVAARHIGPYSIVTQQPLGAKSQLGGQRVTATHLRALSSRGASWIAHEMLTVKSDDVPGRHALYESIVRGVPECRRIDPRSARILERELHALAFDVDIDGETVAIALFDSDAICERMRGVVTKPETLNYRTFQPERHGLFCQDIFGPLGSEDRGTRLGRIEFPCPCVHPWAIPAIATLLALPPKDVDAILAGQRTLAGDPPESWHDTGGFAIHGGLAALDVLSLADSSGDRGDLVRRFVAAGRHPRLLCFESWPVLPPDLRPLVPLDGNRWATSDLNDLYRRLINRTNRTRRLVELNAPEEILINEARMLQEALDTLVENGFRDGPVTGPDRRPLMS
ncbi:MAG TPA: hypothetical protein VGO00_20695, partial [Kofleriaceae bacterium]|nr:hypothetical protein [Kofleriaceae bacterium]